MSDGTYTMADLCDLADVSPRTVRYYISQGLLRAPAGSGPVARYDEGHLARLRLVRRLQREHLPLAEIRARLAALTDEEAVARAEGPPEPPSGSALDYVRSLLGPGLPAAPSPARLGVTPSSGPGAVPPALASRPRSSPGRAAAPSSSPTPERSSWERIALTPDIELNVRRPLDRSQNRAVARLIEAARRILEEDQP